MSVISVTKTDQMLRVVSFGDFPKVEIVSFYCFFGYILYNIYFPIKDKLNHLMFMNVASMYTQSKTRNLIFSNLTVFNCNTNCAL